MDTLDTAIAYGDSEERLGEIGMRRWRVVTKLPAPPSSCSDTAAWVRGMVSGSLRRLGVPALYAILQHDSRQLCGPVGEALYRALRELQDEGTIGKIGVSIYDPEELIPLVSRFRVDIVQAPFNPIDRRLAASGWLRRLADAGTEVHVRSVFLQGLLLMDAARRPAKFGRWKPTFERWDRWLADVGVTPVQACLAFALGVTDVGRVVVGVDSVEQLEEVLQAVDAPRVTAPSALASDDRRLINPSQWSSL